MGLKVKYNSPVILSFTLISFVVLMVSAYIKDLTPYLALPGNFDWVSIDYFRLLSYTCVHSFTDFKMQTDFTHFISNFMLILLIGPVLEEKFGSKDLLLMIIFTAVVTGLLNAIFNNSGIIGASGVALMMVILGSFTNYTKGELPLTFVIVSLFFLGNEIASAVNEDHISHFAHVLGGSAGAVFGFGYKK
jgi:membrane associated rhomboid family serine protease